MEPKDSFSVANKFKYIKKNSFDLIITGRESIDYNGGNISMISEMTNLPLVNACIGLEIVGNTAKHAREIDGGKEMITSPLPMVIGGQKVGVRK